MNLHGQINDACESRPGHPQPCHWSVWIVLECGFHDKMDFSSCDNMLGLANPVTYECSLGLVEFVKNLVIMYLICMCKVTEKVKFLTRRPSVVTHYIYM